MAPSKRSKKPLALDKGQLTISGFFRRTQNDGEDDEY